MIDYEKGVQMKVDVCIVFTLTPILIPTKEGVLLPTYLKAQAPRITATSIPPRNREIWTWTWTWISPSHFICHLHLHLYALLG